MKITVLSLSSGGEDCISEIFSEPSETRKMVPEKTQLLLMEVCKLTLRCVLVLSIYT